MAIKAVLFDLDGTLLPMDQDVFIKTYFKGLSARMARYGYDPKALIDAVWAGTASMIKNTGEKTNETLFWEAFGQVMGPEAVKDRPRFDEFYETDFESVQSVCGFDPHASETVHTLKSAGLQVALATNPIFPAIAVKRRLRWAGLDWEDFALCTAYENISYSKPNPDYYLEIARRLGVAPQECLMVGNDVDDDMVAATIGMKVFLLTDNLINKSETDISLFPHGGYGELSQYIDELTHGSL